MRHVTRGRNRLFAIACALCLSLAAPAAADFDNGLSAFLDGDYRRAREIWLALAGSGDAQSQFGLGMIFEGGRGVPPDAEKAAEWYLRAADQGMSEAQLSLGSLYKHGRGVRRNPKRAAELYLDAARQGNAQAEYNLAALYLGGEGIVPDRELGIAWLRRSAAHRYGRAVQRLNMMDVALEGPEPASLRDSLQQALPSELVSEVPDAPPPSTDTPEISTPTQTSESTERLHILTDISQIAFKSMAIILKLRRRSIGLPSAAVR
jgi:TPR repeat protein